MSTELDPLSHLMKNDSVIIGADVCKPGSNRTVSVVGVVASFDQTLRSWWSCARAQKAGTEILEDFGGIVSQLFECTKKVWDEISHGLIGIMPLNCRFFVFSGRSI